MRGNRKELKQEIKRVYNWVMSLPLLPHRKGKMTIPSLPSGTRPGGTKGKPNRIEGVEMGFLKIQERKKPILSQEKGKK